MKIQFSRIELRDLGKAWLLTSVAFALAMVGFNTSLYVAIPVALVTGGLGMILHELMHKITAAHFGYHSEFRSFDVMLVVSVIIAAFGVVFLAPGAVFLGAHAVDFRKNGFIAWAGPATNIALALLFVPLLPFLGSIAVFGFMINSWLGMFNLIPFMGLDGVKVLAWNPKVFWGTAIVAVALVFCGYFFLGA